jgi:hypothetical protein
MSAGISLLMELLTFIPLTIIVDRIFFIHQGKFNKKLGKCKGIARRGHGIKKIK